MNQTFPEKPLTVGRAYRAPVTLAEVLAAVFPQLHSNSLPIKDFDQGPRTPDSGLRVMGHFGPELPISMVEACPEESDEVVTIHLLRKVCASQERTIEALGARLADAEDEAAAWLSLKQASKGSI